MSGWTYVAAIVLSHINGYSIKMSVENRRQERERKINGSA
jgi:hypothetical protein